MPIACSSTRHAVRVAVFLTCAASLHAAQAAQFDYEASLSGGHSDNIRRSSTDEEDENIAAAGLRFSLDQRGPKLRADAVGNLSYFEYLDNTFDSELLADFSGNAVFAFVPQRFEWIVSDNYGQALADPFAPPTPDNREDINFLSTGPDVTLGLGSRSKVHLGARYSLVTYEDRPLDFDTVSAEAGLVRMLSPASNVSVNVRAAQTTYDDSALDADYDQSEAFVRYDVKGARTQLSLDLGYTEVDRDAATDSEGGLLLRFNATRRLSPASTATLTAGREFSNSGTAFAGMQSTGGVSLDAAPGLQTAQPFTSDYVTLGWNFSRNRTTFSLLASWNDQSYDDVDGAQPSAAVTASDQTLTTAGVQLSRELSPRTSLSLHALYTQADFQQADSDYSDMNGGLVYSWRLSRNVSLRATYDHFNRSSDSPAGDSKENRYWLSLVYGRGTPRSTLAGPEFAVDTGS